MARTKQTARARPVFLPPSSSSEEKTVHIRLLDYTVPKIIIHYSNNDELREALQQRLKGLKLAFAVIPEPCLGYEPRAVKGIDELIAEMENNAPFPLHVKLWCAPAEPQAADQPRTRSPSPHRSQSRKFTSSQCCPRFSCCSPAPWLPCWYCWKEAGFSSAVQSNRYCQPVGKRCCKCTYMNNYED